jgi:hypothetical protein
LHGTPSSTGPYKKPENLSGINVLNQYLKIGDRVDQYYAAKVYRTRDGQIINDAGRPIVGLVPQFMGYLNPIGSGA